MTYRHVNSDQREYSVTELAKIEPAHRQEQEERLRSLEEQLTYLNDSPRPTDYKGLCYRTESIQKLTGSIADLKRRMAATFSVDDLLEGLCAWGNGEPYRKGARPSTVQVAPDLAEALLDRDLLMIKARQLREDPSYCITARGVAVLVRVPPPIAPIEMHPEGKEVALAEVVSWKDLLLVPDYDVHACAILGLRKDQFQTVFQVSQGPGKSHGYFGHPPARLRDQINDSHWDAYKKGFLELSHPGDEKVFPAERVRLAGRGLKLSPAAAAALENMTPEEVKSLTTHAQTMYNNWLHYASTTRQQRRGRSEGFEKSQYGKALVARLKRLPPEAGAIEKLDNDPKAARLAMARLSLLAVGHPMVRRATNRAQAIDMYKAWALDDKTLPYAEFSPSREGALFNAARYIGLTEHSGARWGRAISIALTPEYYHAIGLPLPCRSSNHNGAHWLYAPLYLCAPMPKDPFILKMRNRLLREMLVAYQAEFHPSAPLREDGLGAEPAAISAILHTMAQGEDPRRTRFGSQAYVDILLQIHWQETNARGMKLLEQTIHNGERAWSLTPLGRAIHRSRR